MCGLFVLVDLGKPMRFMNIILHPTPNSILFWDMLVLNGYMVLNAVIGWMTLMAERKGVPPAWWVRPLIYLSIPWAVSIHTVTAFLYCGLPGRGFWLTAILAPRFLASAFAAGPAVLIVLALLVRKFTRFDPGKEAIQTLGKIVTYCIMLNLFFLLLEIFTVFYSQIPDHMDHFIYLFVGYHGHDMLVPWMWTSMACGLAAVIILLNPNNRKKEGVLAVACILVFICTWIDKGMGMIAGGYIPNPLHEVTEYAPHRARVDDHCRDIRPRGPDPHSALQGCHRGEGGSGRLAPIATQPKPTGPPDIRGPFFVCPLALPSRWDYALI